jgi:hypothetical protein
MYNLICLSA